MASTELVLWSMHSRRWCVVARALWGDFQGQRGMWYGVQHEDGHVGKSQYGGHKALVYSG